MNLGTTVNGIFLTANRLTGSAPTTNLALLVALMCSTATVVLYWIAVLYGKSPEAFGFGSLLAFLATWLGIGNHRFKIKRETDFGYVKAKNGHGEETK